MDLWNLIEVSDFTARIVIACACAAAGLLLLRSDRGHKSRISPADVFHEAKLAPMALGPLSVNLETVRITPAAAYDRLRGRIAEASLRTQRMNSCQEGAARHIDVAEAALRRLADEIAGVMPVTVGATLMPRRVLPREMGTHQPELVAA